LVTKTVGLVGEPKLSDAFSGDTDTRTSKEKVKNKMIFLVSTAPPPLKWHIKTGLKLFPVTIFQQFFFGAIYLSFEKCQGYYRNFWNRSVMGGNLSAAK
jgi:hypothetical protein